MEWFTLWFIKPIAEFLGAIALLFGVFVLFILYFIIDECVIQPIKNKRGETNE